MLKYSSCLIERDISIKEELSKGSSMSVKVQKIQASQCETVEAEVNYTVLTVNDVGTPAKVSNDSFGRANFIIHNSQEYIPSQYKLHQFVYLHGFLHIFFIYFVVSIIAFVHWIASLIVLVISVMIFLLSCQYIHVCRTTIPWMMKLPVMNLGGALNKFIEVDIKNINGAFLDAKEANIGCVTAQGAKMKFLLISPVMLYAIRKSIKITIVLFTVSFFDIIFAFVLLYVNGSIAVKGDCESFVIC